MLRNVTQIRIKVSKRWTVPISLNAVIYVGLVFSCPVKGVETHGPVESNRTVSSGETQSLNQAIDGALSSIKTGTPTENLKTRDDVYSELDLLRNEVGRVERALRSFASVSKEALELLSKTLEKGGPRNKLAKDRLDLLIEMKGKTKQELGKEIRGEERVLSDRKMAAQAELFQQVRTSPHLYMGAIASPKQIESIGQALINFLKSEEGKKAVQEMTAKRRQGQGATKPDIKNSVKDLLDSFKSSPFAKALDMLGVNEESLRELRNEVNGEIHLAVFIPSAAFDQTFTKLAQTVVPYFEVDIRSKVEAETEATVWAKAVAEHPRIANSRLKILRNAFTSKVENELPGIKAASTAGALDALKGNRRQVPQGRYESEAYSTAYHQALEEMKATQLQVSRQFIQTLEELPPKEMLEKYRMTFSAIKSVKPSGWTEYPQEPYAVMYEKSTNGDGTIRRETYTGRAFPAANIDFPSILTPERLGRMVEQIK